MRGSLFHVVVGKRSKTESASDTKEKKGGKKVGAALRFLLF